MELPSSADLRKTFDSMLEQQHNGVQGVLKVESETPEPVIGITAMTHGNEPSGLAAIWYYIRNHRLQRLLDATKKGSVIFSVNNIGAAEDYFRLPHSASQLQKEKCRSQEINLNRLPEDILQRQSDSRREIRRALELCEKVFAELDGGLDIHSVRAESQPMIVEVKGAGMDAARRFPINIALTNMIPVQMGHPLSAFYGGLHRDVPVVGIEAGQHERRDSRRYAIQCTRLFLQELGIIPRQGMEKPDSVQGYITEYRVAKGVIPPKSGEFHMSKDFGMFEPVDPETILLTQEDGDGVIRAGMQGCVLMARPVSVQLPSTEEACFLSEPAKQVARASFRKSQVG
ncbi:MAG: succinylglutamate desuccinylase/aspartoacylase family protein [Candidatus Peribacteraceae bacterium]|nr:succinylglutamate desuccinylase/aspartoacylase family protein [Candidatus Peribacteraceae bacterium]